VKHLLERAGGSGRRSSRRRRTEGSKGPGRREDGRTVPAMARVTMTAMWKEDL
jgi:hypothetical protein